MPLTEPVVRAALWACQDVSPYNAFNGLGFDGTELTMPEFIIDNISFEKMTPRAVAHIALPDPASLPGAMIRAPRGRGRQRGNLASLSPPAKPSRMMLAILAH